ncbi:MAG: pyrophosphatase [Chthonomonadaceae bacterium]|nr:pyrophosphatase [Chthonomonadaceae bacterium]
MSEPQIARTPPYPLEAMLFDLDGTVADTHGLIRECYDHAIRVHLGQPAPIEVWQQRVGLPLDTVLLAACAHYDAPCSPETLEAIKTSYRTHMRTQRDNIAAFPGIYETLAELRQRGLRLAIVTTKYREMALHHLETIGMSEFFEAVVAGDDCAHTKPHPEPFQKALAALKARPERTAMVGDSQYDILGAHNAGVYGVAACWGTDSRADLLAALPAYIAERPEQLLDLHSAKI